MATKKTSKASTAPAGFSAEERAAMKARVRELKTTRHRADGEKEVLAAIAKMPEPDRATSARLHQLIRAAAPGLSPKTWYGMPAYANADGKVVCFFRPASKFKDRYLTLGFNDAAQLDDGVMWPTSYALTKLTITEEKRVHALVQKAAGLAG
jgi:uncharacterized protein YdhG (YjbR/CyaY superfamily)